jgi:hypothetical protein
MACPCGRAVEILLRYSSDLFFRGHDFLKLDWNAGFDHSPIIGSDRFSNFIGMNVEVGLAADLITSDMMAMLIFAVNQNVPEFEIFDKNDR